MRAVGMRAVGMRAVAVRAVAVWAVAVGVVSVVAVSPKRGLSFGLRANHCGGLDVVEVGMPLGLQQPAAGMMLWLGMLVDHYLALPHTEIAGGMVSC